MLVPLSPQDELVGAEFLREAPVERSEEHTSELQSRLHLVCRLLLEKKKHNSISTSSISIRLWPLQSNLSPVRPSSSTLCSTNISTIPPMRDAISILTSPLASSSNII